MTNPKFKHDISLLCDSLRLRLPFNMHGAKAFLFLIFFLVFIFLPFGNNALAHNKALYPGDENIDVTYYALDLTINDRDSTISGNVLIRMKALTDNLKYVVLDFSHTLKADSVVGKQNLKFIHQADFLEIEPSVPLSSGELFSVKIFYHGKPKPTGYGGFVFSKHGNIPWIWTLSEPYGAFTWFPCKDNPADKADSASIKITVSKNLFAVSNGVLLKNVYNGDGTRTFLWKTNYPIANYLIAVTVSNFENHTDYFHYSPTDSMPVEHYILPEDYRRAEELFPVTLNALRFFSEIYGTYPFTKEKYGEVEFGFNGGMEHQTITSLGAFTQDVVVHELSHQWFGDKITCATWHDIWLHEGFATYSEALYRERYEGKEAYRMKISRLIERAKEAKGSVYAEDISTLDGIFNYERSYAKGAVILHMLRGVLGDSMFFSLIKSYATSPSFSYGNASIKDFSSFVNRFTGKNLDYFFDEWIFGENFPIYFYSWNYKALGKGKFKATILIEQAENTNPAFFTMPIKLKIKTEKGDTNVVVFNDSLRQSFSFVISTKPTGMIFDPENFILKNAFEQMPNPFASHTLEIYPNYPNPFKEKTTLEFYLPRSGRVKIEFYDALGRRLSTVLNSFMDAGIHKLVLSPRNIKRKLASGIYFVRLSEGIQNVVRKVIYLK